MKKNRVVITGMGLICSAGDNRQQVLESIKSKKTGLSEISKIDSIERIEKVSTKVFGEVNLLDGRFQFSDEIKTKDKTVKLAYLAAKEAILDSKIDLFENKKCALVIGSCNGKLLGLEKLYQNFESIQPQDEILSEFCRDHYSNFDFLHKEYKITGPKFVFVNGCSASNNAIGFAFDLIRSGEVEVAIVGGSDTLTESTIGGFHSLQALSGKPSSPFSERIGLSLGDGAGCIILESEEHAKNRNAKIHSEILSYSFFGDAFHTTSPDETGEGLRYTMDEAIKLANILKMDIKVVCAHGTGTDSNDAVETLSIRNCFNENVNDIVVTSTKSFYGHTLGASGITQMIIMIDSMLQDLVPPILDFGNEREGCDLKYVKNEHMNLVYDKFIANSLAFGGNNVSIVVGKYNDSICCCEEPSSSCHCDEPSSFCHCEEQSDEAISPERDCRATMNTFAIKNDENEKIVITGFSAITPLAKNKDEFFNRIKQAENIADVRKDSRIIGFDSFTISNPNLKWRKFKKKPRVSQLAIEAMEQLLLDANYKIDDNRRTGIIFGICKGGMSVFETTYLDMLKNGIEFYSAMNFPNAVLSAIPGNVAIAFGIKGYNSTLWGPCSAFAGIQYATEILKNKRQDVLIVGGTDQMSMYDKKMLEEKRHKDSFISEGASLILLETEKHAKDRGAKIYAEIAGINTNSFDFDYFETNPSIFKDAFFSCVDETLEKTGIKMEDIDLHINCNFGLEENFRDIFKETITGQDFVGTMESATAVLNIGMGILYLNDGTKSVKNILISAHTLNGVNYSFVLRK